MGDVIDLKIPTTGRVEPDAVLASQIGELSEVILIGANLDGEVSIFASSTSNPEKLLWMVERFKHEIINESLEAK